MLPMPSGFFTVLMKSTTRPELCRNGMGAAYFRIELPPAMIWRGIWNPGYALIAMGGEMRRLRLAPDYR